MNAAVYLIQWDDVQQVVNTSAACANNFTSNLGEPESAGLELEVTAVLTNNLTNEEAFFSYQEVLVLATGTFDRRVRNLPKTVGVSFKYDF